ncbi:MAG: hypothetical protein IKI44_08310 [Bacteroidaceae bacterium]|nr:hypothetical protein [Bacteroidaceae bacterium]
MKKFILLCLMLPGSIFTFAKNTVTRVEQVSTEVTLTDDVDYVITSATPFTGDGLINIVNTDHAVVIIENVKPSAVISGELYKKIQINGRTATTTSCQIRMYDRGTIIFPYTNLSGTNSYKPLTCYTKANFEGESYSNYTEGHSGGYMKTLSATSLNNRIRSFKLKRGYMVTFAVGKSGWGYSRCFIADQEDLEISTLPYMLNGKISSYRILKWWNVHKSGLASDGRAEANAALNSSWCYDWGQGNESLLPDVEWVPNHIYEDWPSSATCGSRSGACIMKTNNEPGNPSDDHPQTVEEVLANWENLMRTGLRLCSESSHDGSWSHLQNFIKAIDERGWRCDLLDLHCYWPAGSFGDFSNYYNQYGGRPIIISEWTWGASWNNNGIFAAAPDGRDSYSLANQQCMYDGTKPILDKLNASKYVERYSIWNSEANCSKVYLNGVVSIFGQYYAENTGGLGYNASLQKIPNNQPLQSTSITDLTAAFNNATGQVTVSWTDPNYERIDSFIVQVKRPSSSIFVTVGAVYPEDQNARDGSTTASYAFVDNDPESGGNEYSVIARYNGKAFTSNTAVAAVSSNRAVGSLRFGELQVAGTDAQTTTYATAFEKRKSPIVVLSAPSVKNTVGKILDLRSNSNTSFSASMAPFVKSDGSPYDVSKAEMAGYLALPKDSTCYDLPNVLDGGEPLTLQCGSVSSVTTDVNHVTFEKAYPEGVVPVVIASAMRATAVSFGIMPRVKNITNTGFDVFIERQNYYASQSFTGATVTYFAMQPGEASLGGGLLISAQCFEDALAVARTTGRPVELTTPLIKPILLLGAQSVKHDIMREIFFNKTTTETVEGVTRVKSFTPNAYLDPTNSTSGTAYSPSEDLGFIAIATDPNGDPGDEPTVTAVRSLEGNGVASESSFDAWTEGNVIRASKSDVRVYGATGLQFMVGQPLAKGLYIVTDGISSKKLNIR